jgi:glycosyltransferase involved in cell wall biosynthesis
VASAVGGVPDALDGAGLLVPPQDPPALAAALRRLLREPAVAARLAARARARALRYDAACAVDAFEDAFCSLVHRARGAHAEAAAAMGR